MPEFADWTPEDVEYFFSEEMGVIGINGRPKLNAKVYIKELKREINLISLAVRVCQRVAQGRA